MFQISLNLELKVIVDRIIVTIFAIVGNFKMQNSFFSLFPDRPADFVLTLLWKTRETVNPPTGFLRARSCKRRKGGKGKKSARRRMDMKSGMNFLLFICKKRMQGLNYS